MQTQFEWSTRSGNVVTYYTLSYEGYRIKQSHYEFGGERNAIASQKQWESNERNAVAMDGGMRLA